MSQHGDVPYNPPPGRDIPKPGWSGNRTGWELDPRLRYAKLVIWLYARKVSDEIRLSSLTLGQNNITAQRLWEECVRKVPGFVEALRARFPDLKVSKLQQKLYGRLLHMYLTKDKPALRKQTVEHPTNCEDLRYWIRVANNLYERPGKPTLLEVVDLFMDPNNKDGAK